MCVRGGYESWVRVCVIGSHVMCEMVRELGGR